MRRKCPSCNSINVRRSSIRRSEGSRSLLFLSPYHCRDCNARFSTVSSKTFVRGAVIGAAILAAVVIWNLMGSADERARDPESINPDAPRLAEAIKLAENNDHNAEYTVAQIYAHGAGVAKNDRRAVSWLERSARHGNVQAQYELGSALREGRGVVQDYERAVNWLQLAAEGGNPRAQLELGRMFGGGWGIPRDKVKAYIWLNLAAAQGVAGAAAARDAALGLLSPGEIIEAQAEARRLSEARPEPSTAVQ